MSTPPHRTTGIDYSDVEELKKEKDIFWFERDKRNVLDKYKGLPNEEIVKDLKKTQIPCAVMMSQISGDFNFSSVIRSSNNFNVSKVFYFGNKKYDKRGAISTYLYTDVIHLDSFEEIVELKKDYFFVGLENNIPGTASLSKFSWPKNSLIVLGEEGCGIHKSVIDLLDYTVEIPSIGTTRSLNVASAATVALYDYYTKYAENLNGIQN